jgi:hypothetical protein
MEQIVELDKEHVAVGPGYPSPWIIRRKDQGQLNKYLVGTFFSLQEVKDHHSKWAKGKLYRRDNLGRFLGPDVGIA